MNPDTMREQILSLMGSMSYMPMRKRGVAKSLHIPDADYRAFRTLLEEMAESGEIAELRRGKFGLPDPQSSESSESSHPSDRSDPSHFRESEDGDAEDAGEDEPAQPKDARATGERAPKGTTVGRVEVKRGGMGFLLSEPPGNDIFIAEGDLAGALSGDLVAVALKKQQHQRGGRRGKFGSGGYGGAGRSRPSG